MNVTERQCDSSQGLRECKTVLAVNVRYSSFSISRQFSRAESVKLFLLLM